MIPIVAGALGTVPKDLIKRLQELNIRARIETMYTIVLLRSVKIMRRVFETCVDLLSFRPQ